jgi:hypothetical protein
LIYNSKSKIKLIITLRENDKLGGRYIKDMTKKVINMLTSEISVTFNKSKTGSKLNS